MNPRSRHYARRQMFLARLQLLAILASIERLREVEAQAGPHVDARLAHTFELEAGYYVAESYYVAREMAHWANNAARVPLTYEA